MVKEKLISSLRNGLTGKKGQLIGLTHKQIAAKLSKELVTNITPRSVKHYVTYLNFTGKKLQSRKQGRPSKSEDSNFILRLLRAQELLRISGRSASYIYHLLNNKSLIQGSKSSFHAKIKRDLSTDKISISFISTLNIQTDQHSMLKRYSLRISATMLEITPDCRYLVYLIGYETKTGYLQVLSFDAESTPVKKPIGRPKKPPEKDDWLSRQTNAEGKSVMYLSQPLLMKCLHHFTKTIWLPICNITLIDSPTIHLSVHPSEKRQIDISPFNLITVEMRGSQLEEYLNRKARSSSTICESILTGINVLNMDAAQNIKNERDELQEELKLGNKLKKFVWPPSKKIDQKRIDLVNTLKTCKAKYRYFPRIPTQINPKSKRIRLICLPRLLLPQQQPADC